MNHGFSDPGTDGRRFRSGDYVRCKCSPREGTVLKVNGNAVKVALLGEGAHWVGVSDLMHSMPENFVYHSQVEDLLAELAKIPEDRMEKMLGRWDDDFQSAESVVEQVVQWYADGPGPPCDFPLDSPDDTVHDEPDDVTKPAHYTSHPCGLECGDIAEEFVYNVGCAIKYLWRAGLKDDRLKDLRKAEQYVQREIRREIRARERDVSVSSVEELRPDER